jgi:hypothetical protein
MFPTCRMCAASNKTTLTTCQLVVFGKHNFQAGMSQLGAAMLSIFYAWLCFAHHASVLGPYARLYIVVLHTGLGA